MKEALKYLKLWQKKREELKINDDPKSDWMQMQGMLDQFMPPKPVPPVKVKPWHIAHFKLILAVLVTISGVTAVYLGVYKTSAKHNNHNQKLDCQKNGIKDSLQNVQIQGTLAADSNSTTGATNPANDGSAGFDKRNAAGLKNATASKGDGANNEKANSPSTIKPNLAQSGTPGLRKNSPAISPGSNQVNASIAGGALQHILNNAGGANQNNPSNVAQTGRNNQGTRNDVIAATTSHKLGGIQMYPAAVNDKSKVHHGSTSLNSQFSNRAGNVSAQSKSGNTQLQPANKNSDGQLTTGNTANQHFGRVAETSENYFINIAPPGMGFKVDMNKPFEPSPVVKSRWLNKIPVSYRLKPLQKDKNKKLSNSSSKTVEWGILTGVNTSGSFTPKSQNANFYGCSPVDTYFGLFASYPVKDKWAVGAQVKFFSPRTVSGSYTFTNKAKLDSGASFKITDKRKAYAVEIPISLVYKVNNNLGLKFGPVFDLPVKQVKGTVTLSAPATKADSAYYSTAKSLADSTAKFNPKFGYGLSGGINLHVNRFIFEATYLKRFNSDKVSSNIGGYTSHPGTLQLTIGFQLNKRKR